MMMKPKEIVGVASLALIALGVFALHAFLSREEEDRVVPVLMLPEDMAAAEYAQPAFGDAVRVWLLNNPEILYEMAARLDEGRAAAAVASDRTLIDAHRDALFGDPRDGRVGDGAPVFVEFVDYNCGFCRRNHIDVKAWADANPGQAVIIKEFPILGPGSETAARAVLAIRNLHGMRAYRALHNAFLEMDGPLEEAGVHALLDDLALDDDWDVDAVRAEMNADAITAHIEDTRRLATALGITGTPGFVFHGLIGRGLMSLEQLEAATDTEGDVRHGRR